MNNQEQIIKLYEHALKAILNSIDKTSPMAKIIKATLEHCEELKK